MISTQPVILEKLMEVKIMVKKSKKYKLNKEDGTKILKGAYIAVGGALIFYAAELLPQIDFGTAATPIVVAVGGILINLAKKYFEGKK